MIEAVKNVARYTNDTTLVFLYSSLGARLPWRFPPRLGGKRLVAGFGCFAFLDCVWGESSGWYAGRAYVSRLHWVWRAVMEMYMYVLYCI